MSEIGDAHVWIGKGRDAGTTLVETLVVVGIIAMVALIGFPRLQQTIQLMGQHQTISLVATRLREARARAMSLDAPVAFTVARDGTAFGDAAVRLDSVTPGVTVTQVAPQGAKIAFFGDGSSSGGVVLVRGAGRANAVSVQASGGAVAVSS